MQDGSRAEDRVRGGRALDSRAPVRSGAGASGWAIAVFAAVLAVSLGVVAALPPMFRSTATVLVDREQVPETFVRSAVTGEVETRLQRISQEVLSRERLARLIERFDLYPQLPRPSTNESAIEQMRRDIQLELKVVEPGRPPPRWPSPSATGAAIPRTSPTSPMRSPASTSSATRSIRERQASGTAEFLKAQIAEMKAKLDEQERRIGQAPLPMEADLAGLERLNMRLRVNSDRQLRAMDRRERLVKEAEGPVLAPTPGAPPETAAVRLAKLKQELAELKTRYTDKYPDVIRIKGEIAALEAIAGAPARSDPATPAGRAALGQGRARARSMRSSGC